MSSSSDSVSFADPWLKCLVSDESCLFLFFRWFCVWLSLKLARSYCGSLLDVCSFYCFFFILLCTAWTYFFACRFALHLISWDSIICRSWLKFLVTSATLKFSSLLLPWTLFCSYLCFTTFPAVFSGVVIGENAAFGDRTVSFSDVCCWWCGSLPTSSWSLLAGSFWSGGDSIYSVSLAGGWIGIWRELSMVR